MLVLVLTVVLFYFLIFFVLFFLCSCCVVFVFHFCSCFRPCFAIWFLFSFSFFPFVLFCHYFCFCSGIVFLCCFVVASIFVPVFFIASVLLCLVLVLVYVLVFRPLSFVLRTSFFVLRSQRSVLRSPFSVFRLTPFRCSIVLFFPVIFFFRGRFRFGYLEFETRKYGHHTPWTCYAPPRRENPVPLFCVTKLLGSQTATRRSWRYGNRHRTPPCPFALLAGGNVSIFCSVANRNSGLGSSP